MELYVCFSSYNLHQLNISVIIGRSGRTLHDERLSISVNEAKPDASSHWSTTRVRTGSDVTVDILCKVNRKTGVVPKLSLITPERGLLNLPNLSIQTSAEHRKHLARLFVKTREAVPDPRLQNTFKLVTTEPDSTHNQSI